MVMPWFTQSVELSVQAANLGIKQPRNGIMVAVNCLQWEQLPHWVQANACFVFCDNTNSEKTKRKVKKPARWSTVVQHWSTGFNSFWSQLSAHVHSGSLKSRLKIRLHVCFCVFVAIECFCTHVSVCLHALSAAGGCNVYRAHSVITAVYDCIK